MKTLYKNVTVYSENDSYKADILVDGTDIADVGADLNCDADLIYDYRSCSASRPVRYPCSFQGSRTDL